MHAARTRPPLEVSADGSGVSCRTPGRGCWPNGDRSCGRPTCKGRAPGGRVDLEGHELHFQIGAARPRPWGTGHDGVKSFSQQREPESRGIARAPDELDVINAQRSVVVDSSKLDRRHAAHDAR